MNIEQTLTPESVDLDFLTQQINAETPQYGSAYPFALWIRDAAGGILAGCNGSVVFGAIYTDQLWVHPTHRQSGLGRQLMEHVHTYGRSVGCSMATVATMDFQGVQLFYEKLGYVSDFERQGYVAGSSCIFLRKIL